MTTDYTPRLFKGLQKWQVRSLRHFFIPIGSAILVYVILVPTVQDKGMLFLTSWLLSLGFLIFSYALDDFQKLKSISGKRAVLARFISVTINSILLALGFMFMVITFLTQNNADLITFDWEAKLMLIALDKLYILIGFALLTWIVSNIIAFRLIKG